MKYNMVDWLSYYALIIIKLETEPVRDDVQWHQLQLFILAYFRQYLLNMSKASKKEGKQMFKWAELLRKNLVETCLEAHARGNFTDSFFYKFNSFKFTIFIHSYILTQMANILTQFLIHNFNNNVSVA